MKSFPTEISEKHVKTRAPRAITAGSDVFAIRITVIVKFDFWPWGCGIYYDIRYNHPKINCFSGLYPPFWSR